MTFSAPEAATRWWRWPRKWVVALLTALLRWATGTLTDRIFGWANALSGGSRPLPPLRNPLLLDSALGLAAKIRDGQVTCCSVVRAYMQRIEEVNPVVNAAVDQRYSAALKEAALVDQFVGSGEVTREAMERDTPLLGVPLSVKEAIMVEGMSFTAGVVSRRGVRASEDADVIALLRQAGAIPLVVTNTSEQCFWMEAYNNVHGRTNNPYDPKRTPGGSSGGEGALLAAAGSVVGVGNDIGGSVRIPAFFCGVFGHKPSRGLVPNRGHFPPTEPALQQYIGTGPMCRYAGDLRPMLRAMAGPDARFLQLDAKVDLKSLKVFYMEDDGGGGFTLPPTPEVRGAVRKVVEHLRRVCTVPPQPVRMRGLRHGFPVWACAVSAAVAGVAPVEARVFGGAGGGAPLRELALWLAGCSAYSLPAIATVLVERLLAPRSKEEAEPFLRVRRSLEADFQTLLQDDCVFVMPTLPLQASHHYANTVRAQNCGYVAAFNVLGLPATSCPVARDRRGLPLGVQVVAGLRNDHLCLAVARELERAFGGWVCPGPLP